MRTTDEALETLGPRLRSLRTKRGFTLTEMADRTGVSTSTLSRLESGERRATLELLLPIAAMLGVGLDELVGLDASPDPRVRGLPIRRHGRTYVPLSSGGDGPSAFRVTLPPVPAKHAIEQRVHEGTDWFLVLSGQVRLALGDQEHLLQEGEAVEFDTRVPHGTAAAGSGPAEILHLFSRAGERVHLREV